MLHRGSRVEDVSWSEGRAAVDEPLVGERLECFADPTRCVDEQRLERGHRGSAGLDGRIAGDLDLADHFCSAVRSFRHGGRDTGEHRPRRSLGIERVTLAVVAPLAPVATVDLDDVEPLSAHGAREADPVGTGTFNPEGFEVTERACPRHQVGIAGPVRRHPERREPGAQVIDRYRDMLVLVGVDADDHLDRRIVTRDAVRHVAGPLSGWRRRLVGRADRTVTGLSSQAPIRSLPSRPGNIWMRAARPGRQILARTRSRSAAESEPAGQQHDHAHSLRWQPHPPRRRHPAGARQRRAHRPPTRPRSTSADRHDVARHRSRRPRRLRAPPAARLRVGEHRSLARREDRQPRDGRFNCDRPRQVSSRAGVKHQ